MRTKRLGKTDLELTVLGFGAWAIGGSGWTLSWGPQDDDESIASIQKALDAGMNWIDTAPIYGRGRSEEVIGQAIAGRAQKPILATKCGRLDDDEGNLFGDLSRNAIRKEFEESLERLRVDHIDLYQLHFPEPDKDLEEAWTAIAELKDEGRVTAIGLSNCNVGQLERCQAIAPIDSLQPSYSLLDRAIEQDVLDYCGRHGIGVIVYSPQAGGMLTGAMTRERLASLPPDDWRVSFNLPRFSEPQFSRNLALVDLLREIGARHGATPGEVAIAWTLRRPEVTSAIVGLRKPEQVDGVVGADLVLDPDELEQLEALLARDPAEFAAV